MKPSERLRAAYDRLLTDGWFQGDYEAPNGARCVLGALECDTPMQDGLAERTYLRRAIGGERVDLALWNDTKGRTFDEVCDVFQKAIKLAEADEALTG